MFELEIITNLVNLICNNTQYKKEMNRIETFEIKQKTKRKSLQFSIIKTKDNRAYFQYECTQTAKDETNNITKKN